jgi:hypothetical protein
VALDREEDHAHPVLARGRKSEAEPGAFPREKPVRDLDENSGPIARFRIAAASSAVRKVHEDFNALIDDVVGFSTLDVGYEADTACIVLIAGVIKALLIG